MLLYEYRVRDEFERLRAYATRIRSAFEAERAPDELLADVANLRSMFQSFSAALPPGIADRGSMARHLWWLDKRLGEGSRTACIGDIISICDYDLPEMEAGFRQRCGAQEHYDSELRDAISELLLRREFDSALRKAFVILKERLVRTFGVDRGLDGTALVNAIFGRDSALVPSMSDADRQAFRDLLAGLYGVFRNRYMHEATNPPWREVDAVLSMINQVLGAVDGLALAAPGVRERARGSAPGR